MNDEVFMIAILVLVVLIFLLQIEQYRTMLKLASYYNPDSAPPSEMRWSSSFFQKSKKVPKSVKAKASSAKSTKGPRR